MNRQNIPECWKTPKYVLDDGTVEVYRGYIVSDQGRIASLMGKTMKFLKHHKRPDGYYKVNIRFNNKKYDRNIHRILLSTFRMDSWFKDAECDHANRIRADNRLCNLKWVKKNENYTNRKYNPLKKIRVTYLSDKHTEIYDSMYDVDKAFGKREGWCISMICKCKGFNKKYNIMIEKI